MATKWHLTNELSVGHVRPKFKPLRDALPSAERGSKCVNPPSPAAREEGEGEGPFGGLFALFIRILGRRGGAEVDGAVEQGERVTALRGDGERRMGMGTATPLSLNDACSAAGPPRNAFTTSSPV